MTTRPPDDADFPLTPATGGWGVSALIFLLLLGVYLGNRRQAIGSNDTIGATYLPLAILRGDGPVLDRFGAVWAPPGRPVPSYLARSRGHLVSRYPVAPALLMVPLVAPQLWYFDRERPGWDRAVASTFEICQRSVKVASGLIGAVLGVALYQLLRRAGLPREALIATLAACLGSDLWVVASQAPWQHGPAALMLVLTLLALRPGVEVGRLRLFLGGLAAALMVAFRPVDLVAAAVVTGWAGWTFGRRAGWFLPGPVVVGGLLLGWNLYWFGVPEGGQRALEALHGGDSGVFAGNPVEGLAGTLLSPGRGLFVFCPWVAGALLLLPATWRRLRTWPLAAWLTVGLLPYVAMLAKYNVWWGGHTFGPRYWADMTPVFAIFFAFAVGWARRHSPPARAGLIASVVAAVGIQAVGALCFPSSWNLKPDNVDTHPARLWDWVDSELTRGLREGVHPW